MGHYDDAYARDRERIDQEHKERVLHEHEAMPDKDGSEALHFKMALEFVLEAYAGHTKSYPERVKAHVHLGRLRGVLK